LFAGPLYTVFKALTAIKLAAALREEGVNAVPMFWIAAEDHDFEEVNHTRLVNREGQLVTITYTACSPKEGKPVGHVRLAEGIRENIDQLLAALPESEFIPQLATDLREAYQPGDSFAVAFGKLMMRWLSKYGVVLINPLDDRLKQVAVRFTRAPSPARQNSLRNWSMKVPRSKPLVITRRSSPATKPCRSLCSTKVAEPQ
jgi:uncharacterized protein YllA (UPF0747 family)